MSEHRDSEALMEHAAHLGNLNQAIVATGLVSVGLFTRYLSM